MSYEYFFKPEPPLTTEQVNRLIESLTMTELSIIRQSITEFGVALRDTNSVVREDMTIGIRTSEIYMDFHWCNGIQRDRTIELVCDLLNKIGVKAVFVER